MVARYGSSRREDGNRFPTKPTEMMMPEPGISRVRICGAGRTSEAPGVRPGAGDLRGHLEHGRCRRAHDVGLHGCGCRQQPAHGRALAPGRGRGVCGALTVAELAAALPESGGDYIYLHEAYGPGVAFLSGWVSFLIGFAGADRGGGLRRRHVLAGPAGPGRCGGPACPPGGRDRGDRCSRRHSHVEPARHDVGSILRSPCSKSAFWSRSW